MTQAQDSDLKFMGESSHPGGQFRDVAVLGQARLNGDVSCRSFSCMGEAQVQGALESGKTSVMGQMKVTGPVAAGDLSVMGQLACSATLRGRVLSCMGQLQAQGQLDAERLKLFGQLTVGGDCNVDDFDSRGQFQIDGLLSVDNLLVRPYGECRVGEIGGARLEVRRRGGVLAWLGGLLSWPRHSRLEAQAIEGDDVCLEDTDARLVRGTRIRIGRGCRVDLVEYRASYTCDPGAQVGSVRKV